MIILKPEITKCHILFLIGMMVSSAGLAQESANLTIEECYDRARSHYPLSRNLDLMDEEKALRIKNIGTGYLPELLFNAEGKYLSKVIDLNESLPVPGYDIPSPPNDQYSFLLTLNQLVFDGGMVRQRKAIEAAQTQTRKQALEVDLYQLKARINVAFFTVLFQQCNDSLYALTENELEERIAVAESGVHNGVVLPAQLDQLNAEKIIIEQKRIENRHLIRNGLQILEILIDSTLPEQVVLQRPRLEVDPGATINRPEIELFQ